MNSNISTNIYTSSRRNDSDSSAEADLAANPTIIVRYVFITS